MPLCTRPGCSQSFEDSERSKENACCFHHGKPVFHEGRKGWTCCKRRVDTFEEFTQIPGCSYGRHTDEPLEDDSITALLQSAREEAAAAPADNGFISAPKNNPPPTKAPPLRGGFKSPEEGRVPTQEQLERARRKKEADEATSSAGSGAAAGIPDDPENAVIVEGAKCMRSGCKTGVFTAGMARSDTECQFHAGSPIFHEGSKGWSCCKQRVLDFGQFLEIPTCCQGKHRFVDLEKPADVRDCRFDSYQQGLTVSLSVYAKLVDPAASTVHISANAVDVKLKFKDGMRFERVFNLPGQAVPEQSSHRFMSTKVEIKLQRAAAGEPWTL